MALLAGKVALVTGGASGIGLAGVQLMAAEGAAVMVADLDAERGRAAAARLAEAGHEAAFVRMDIRDGAEVAAMAAATTARFGRIDVLFHNAVDVAFVNRRDARATELDDEVWDALIDVVLSGTFRCVKSVGRQMLAQRAGSIVLTASVDALIGQAGLDGYTAAKGGVVALTRSLAAGLSPEGVRVNAICPGFVATPHQAAFLDDPASRARIAAMHLTGILEASDIAEMAVFLGSDRARHVTGGIFPVDGGYTAFKGGMDVKAVLAR